MIRSTDRILTTHTGSLPRPSDLIEMLEAREEGRSYDPAALDARIREAVAEVVRKQVEAGVDVVSDGEQGKPYYSTYIKNRVRGFDGEQTKVVRPSGDEREFPEFVARWAATSSKIIKRPSCTGPIEWRDFAAVEHDINNFKAAVTAAKPVDAFMSAASPGVIAHFLGNDYYPTEDAYLEALAGIMRKEYEAIVEAGFVLQLDCPDLAMSRSTEHIDLSLEAFLKIAQRHVEVLNEATKNIPAERMRIHLCWGNYEGPHLHDVPIKDILDVVFTARAAAISFEGANPRHEHEWAVWKEVKLPDGKAIIPGVLDSTNNFIEHPQLIAQRLVRYAELVGRENVMAGSDCGFATDAARKVVDPKIVWAKLHAMAEGAAIASDQLWARKKQVANL